MNGEPATEAKVEWNPEARRSIRKQPYLVWFLCENPTTDTHKPEEQTTEDKSSEVQNLTLSLTHSWALEPVDTTVDTTSGLGFCPNGKSSELQMQVQDQST